MKDERKRKKKEKVDAVMCVDTSCYFSLDNIVADARVCCNLDQREE